MKSFARFFLSGAVGGGAARSGSMVMPCLPLGSVQAPPRPCAHSYRRSLHAQPGPRVDADEDQVNDEVGEQDADDDVDEDALQQEVVLVPDGGVEQLAQARVLERDLGD